MKKIVVAVMLMLVAFAGNSQIQMLRYNDEFSHLKHDTVRKTGYEHLKQIPIGRNIRISFGGEVREQLQYYKNRNFGDAPATSGDGSTTQLWQRVMAHTNVTIGGKLRVFAQVGSTYRYLNDGPLTPEIDENKLSLHQAFADYHFNGKWLIRAGRQEISYGSHRLITFREGPNTRLAFDAAIVRHSSEKRTIDFLAITPVTSRPGVFDDKSFEDFILGVYATEHVVGSKLIVDAYVLNFKSDRRKYQKLSGDENRQSYGVRVFSKQQRFNYELEATYQSGKFNDLTISAYSVSGDVNYAIIPGCALTIGMGGNYVSGDRNKNDGQLNTYNLMFSKPQFGLTAPIGASNIVDINPYVSVRPTKTTQLYLGAYRMWRQSVNDGTYSPLAILVRPIDNSEPVSEKEIGTQLTMESSWQVCKNLSLAIDAGYFAAGDCVKATGNGQDITYLSFKVGLKF